MKLIFSFIHPQLPNMDTQEYTHKKATTKNKTTRTRNEAHLTQLQLKIRREKSQVSPNSDLDTANRDDRRNQEPRPEICRSVARRRRASSSGAPDPIRVVKTRPPCGNVYS